MNIFKLLCLTTLLLSWTIVTANDDSDDDNDSDTNSQSDSDDEEHVIPEYEFVYKTEKYKSGAKQGQVHHKCSLIIPPYVFKKRKVKNDRVTFSCNSCQKEGVNNYAYARKFDYPPKQTKLWMSLM